MANSLKKNRDMTQEEKELLAKDLFSRALSGVKVDYRGRVYTLGYNLYLKEGDTAFESYPMQCFLDKVDSIKPYLRPMSSMTEEEKKSYHIIKDRLCEACIHGTIKDIAYWTNSLDLWFYKYHFDNANLIEKGLAIEVTEENNPYK